MTPREAYDLLARTPSITARAVGRFLAQGQRVENLARRMANPQTPSTEQSFVTPACPGFPRLLKELEDCPLRLFHRGLPLSRLSPHCVAVVGSRKASRYGISWSRRLGTELARHGISVCSGLAMGIDAAAHQGALEAALTQKTAGVPVAILGHGADQVYPEQNRLLRQQMESQGIVLSEYPPAHPPSRWTFPERNRIIAGMCQSVVIVEAGQRSGSLHTARFANEAGRDVWVLPNRPGTPNSAGVLSLLRDGAGPIFEVEEFVRQLVADLRITHPLVEPEFAKVADEIPPELLAILLALAQDEEGRCSELCQALQLSAADLAGQLAELEILGLIERRFDGTWALLGWERVEKHLQLCRELVTRERRATRAA